MEADKITQEQLLGTQSRQADFRSKFELPLLGVRRDSGVLPGILAFLSSKQDCFGVL